MGELSRTTFVLGLTGDQSSTIFPTSGSIVMKELNREFGSSTSLPLAKLISLALYCYNQCVRLICGLDSQDHNGDRGLSILAVTGYAPLRGVPQRCKIRGPRGCPVPLFAFGDRFSSGADCLGLARPQSPIIATPFRAKQSLRCGGLTSIPRDSQSHGVYAKSF